MYDSFLEFPEEKRPPDDIWDKPEEVTEWFNRVYKKGNSSKTQEFITIDLNEVEG